MKKIPENILRFFQNQGFVIVSTIDKSGLVHSACKGIVKIEGTGRIYLLDLYRARTYINLKNNPAISVTAVDEHKFSGWCLKGRAKILNAGEVSGELIREWEAKISGRIAYRLLKNIREEKGHPRHPESQLPKPQYMILMEAEEIVDLTPQHLK
ncbi:MAG: pyridoxamine 5'-phosphate oxidase family protein [Candidatus Omnitrophica bacterium]|nr:pyridoxamine 5'-phosphate oxidase family protein [Candidatus Omnitrophota bacterium]